MVDLCLCLLGIKCVECVMILYYCDWIEGLIIPILLYEFKYVKILMIIHQILLVSVTPWSRECNVTK